MSNEEKQFFGKRTYLIHTKKNPDWAVKKILKVTAHFFIPLNLIELFSSKKLLPNL